MSITLDQAAIRRVAHKLLDELLDKVGDALMDVGLAIIDPEEYRALQSPSVEEKTEPEKPVPEPLRAKAPEPPAEASAGRRTGQRVDGSLRVAAVIQDGVLRPCIYIPAVIAGHAGLVIGGRCACERRGHELVISPSAEGIKIGRRGDTERVRITFFGLVSAKKYRAEFVAHHLDDRHRLVIARPSWWPAAPEAPPSAAPHEDAPSPAATVHSSRSPAAPGGKGTQCHTCGEFRKRDDLYECPACALLVCRPETSQCFDSHVRRCHHSKATGRAPVPKREEART